MSNTLSTSTGVKGEYQVMVLDAEGNIKQDTGWFDNMLLDNFFSVLSYATNNRWNTANRLHLLRVGTGTTPPVETQTSLINVIATSTEYTAVVSSQYTDAFGRACQDWEDTFTFPQGSVIGSISEVGWAVGTTTSPTVHSRALITDINGNPTTITLTAQDQLVVKYKIKLIDIFKEGSGTITLNGQNYNWISRRSEPPPPESGGYFTSLLGGEWNFNSEVRHGSVIFGEHGVRPSGGTVGTTKSHPIVDARPRLGVSSVVVSYTISEANNAAGIKTIGSRGASSGAYWCNKFEFTPPIPKTNQQVLNLTLEHTITRV